MYSIYGALFYVGLLLFVFALWNLQQIKRLMNNGIKTEAIVINLIQSRNSDGDVLFKPVFEYSDVFNKTHVFKSYVSSSPATYSVGEQVAVIYDPMDFRNVRVISFWDLYRLFVLMLCVSTPLLIIGGSYILYEKGIFL